MPRRRFDEWAGHIPARLGRAPQMSYVQVLPLLLKTVEVRRRLASTSIWGSPGERAGVGEPAAELLGHTDPEVTVEHHLRRDEHLNPLNAGLLDQAFAHDDGEGVA